MNRDQTMRLALRTSTFLNFGAALLFAFPSSLGQLMGLPTPVASFYSVFLAFLIALFGATYGWLARQPVIDRPLVVFSSIGKTGFVVISFFCWLLGEVPLRTVVLANGDLAFVAIFVWWLLGETEPGTAAVGPAVASRGQGRA